MKGGGKIGPVLAVFEDNIAKNNVYQPGKSFLTTIASECSTPKLRSSKINKKKVELELEADITGGIEGGPLQSRRGNSITKYISDIPYGSTNGKGELWVKTAVGIDSSSKRMELFNASATTVTVSDEESAFSCMPLLQQSQTKRPVRKIKVVRSNEELDDFATQSIKLRIERSSKENRRLSGRSTFSNAVDQQERQDLSVINFSSREDATKAPLGATRLFQKSPLDKIAATIKRVNSSNSLRKAAHAAAGTKSPKSLSSKSTVGKKDKIRKKLSDYVNQSPTSGNRKVYEKSITSLPIANVFNDPVCKDSFSSLPIVLSPIKTSKGITVTTRRCSIDRKSTNLEIDSVLSPETVKFTANPAIPTVTASPKKMQSSSGADEIDMEYGPQDMYSKSIVLLESLPKQPKRTGSIAKAARRSSVELSEKIENHEEKTGSSSVAEVMDMEYGPQDMYSKPIVPLESLPKQPKRTGSIAKAARRSSIELCGRVENYETDCTCGMTIVSDDSTMAKTPDTASLSSSKIRALESSIICVLPAVEASHISSNSQLIGMEYEQRDMKTKASNPSPQSQTGTELTQKLQQLNNDDNTECSEILDVGSISTGQISEEFGFNRKTPSKFSSNLSLFTLDMNKCPKLPNCRNNSREVEDDAESFPTMATASVIILPRRDEVVGILRLKPTTRNTTRHVQFADQQPGGGRRMSLDSSSRNDSLPVRPRRSNNFHLDRLKDSRHGQVASQPTEPLHFMSIMAATRIQAVVRCWIQWKSTRLVLLSRKLKRIEENRKRDLARIQREKWHFFESIQSEIVERERRLEAQVSLGEKLSDHLKRDSALVRDQTQKLKEYSQNLKKNNDHLDQSIRLHRENVSTINIMIELLQEKSDLLLMSSKKYASRIDKLHEELEYTSSQVEVEFHDKVRTRKTIKTILRHMKKRFSVVDPLFVDSLFQIANGGGRVKCKDQGHRSLPLDTVGTNEFGKNSFDLLLNLHDNDMMSVYSDVTDFSNGSCNGGWDRCRRNETCTSHLNGSRKSSISFKMKELNHSFNDGKNKSCGNSYASYGGGGNLSTSAPNKAINDSNSTNGNSFASYNGLALANVEDSTKVGRRTSYHREDSADLTIGDFDTITEEVSQLGEESIGS